MFDNDAADAARGTGEGRSGGSRFSGRREGAGGRGADRGERGSFGRRRVCAFCMDGSKMIDYKDVGKLRRYLSDRGKIEPRRKTGTCAKHQRRLSVVLKWARELALVPYTADHVRFLGR